MDKTSGSGPEDWGFESLWAHRDFKERCQSGLMSTSGKRVWSQDHRGFESRPLRQLKMAHSKIIWIIIVSVIATTLIAGAWIILSRNQTENLGQAQLALDNLPNQKVEPTLQPPDSNYRVVLKENPQNNSKTDVYLKNPDNNKEELFITLTDVYSQHYHNSEYHFGNLYIIRRIGYDGSADENWSDELWKYNSQKKGAKMYSGKGIDFRVAPDEKYIAIQDEKLTMIDQSGKVVHAYPLDNLSLDDNQDLQIGLLKWSDNGSQFWGDLFLTAYPQAFYKIDTDSWEVDKYDVSKLGFSDDYDLNGNNGKIAYSDHSVMFDASAAQEDEQSGTKVSLIIYDLKTKAQKQIAVSVTKVFEPKWMADNTIEYNDPNSNSRVEKTVE